MKNELIDTFLYELKTRKDLRSQEAYEIAKAILDENLITYNRLAERFVDTPDRIKRLISYACYVLGIKGRSIDAIRTAYIKFLEDEVELLSYDPRQEIRDETIIRVLQTHFGKRDRKERSDNTH